MAAYAAKGSPMGARTVRYRGYQLVIQPPLSAIGRWHALVWPPSKEPPTIMPAQESEESAVRDAQKAVDRMLSEADAIA